jgi:PE family
MSFLFSDPEALAAAASDLSGIGSTLSTANAAAAAPTSAVAAAAADQVSAQVAAFLSEHGLGYQQISAQIAGFHDQFVQTLSAGAGAYATAEADAAQNLAGAVNAPAATLLGGGGVTGVAGAAAVAGGAVSGAVNQAGSVVAGSTNFLGGGAGLLGAGLLGGAAQAIAGEAGAAVNALSGAAVNAVSGAMTEVESVVAGSANLLGGAGLFGGVGQAAALLLGPTGGMRALTAASALLAPAAVTNAAAVSAANAFAPIAESIENAYLLIEPYVQYGFELASYAVGWLPWIGIVAPQILYFYNLFEPMVQSGLFNLLDWLGGTITFTQGLNNFIGATTASINYFIQTEINWFLSLLPPLPPLPPSFP